MSSSEWTDDRIETAFRARFDRPAPASLEPAIREAIASNPPGRSGQFAFPFKALAASTVVVLMAVTGAAVLGSPSVRTTDDPRSSGVGASASVDATASGSDGSASPSNDAQGSVLGLDIITVSEALAIRALDGDDREIAVGGWFTPAPIQHCPAVGPPSPLLPGCREAWLTDEAEVLFRLTNGSMSVRQPAGPAFQPLFDGLDRSWMPPPPRASDSVPVEVVVLGHFDDRRARLCPADVLDQCRDRFVVDRVARVGGIEQPLSHQVMVTDTGPGDSLEDVLAVVAKVSPGSEVLSVVTADNASIGRIEPELEYVPDPGYDASVYIPIKWIVRVLQGGQLETYVVWDDQDIVWQMTENGPVRVGSALRRPHGWGASWPPSGAVVVELTSEVGADQPVQVAVVDRSGRLADAREDGASDLESTAENGWVHAAQPPGQPNRIRLAWLGGVCDTQVTVTIAADLRTITLDRGPLPACDAMGVERGVILDFTGAVDVPSIQLLRTIDIRY